MHEPTKENIAAALREAADRVAAGDSFEGYIEWSLINDKFFASFRVGNLHGGQGGVRVYGKNPRPEIDE